MAFVQIPKSNTLRMVRTDNQGSNLPNFDNRLLWQEDYVDYNDRPYAQKISSSDNILIQYSTDYTTVTAKLYDNTDTLVSDESSNITLLLASTTFSIYDLLFTVAAQGYYYLVLDFDASTEIYKSEIFQIDGYTADNMVKIEYNTSENDGITYLNNETFVIRFEGRIVEYDSGVNKEVYTNFNESLTALNAYPIRKMKLEYYGIPRYMIEKLNIALAHEVFKVNDVEYQTDDSPGVELIGDKTDVTNLYEGDITLQDVDYESYVLATDDEPADTFHILIDGSGNKSIMKEGGTNYYNTYKH